MAWPYSGSWDGQPLTNLPTILAAICRAINERITECDLLGESLGIVAFPTASGTSNYPSASDFTGMSMFEDVHDLLNTIRSEIVTMANTVDWYTDGTFTTTWGDVAGSDPAIEAILDDVGLLPNINVPSSVTNANWYLTVKGVLDRLIYYKGAQSATFDGDYSTDFDFADAWGGSGTISAIPTPPPSSYTLIRAPFGGEGWKVARDTNIDHISAGIQGATQADYTITITGSTGATGFPAVYGSVDGEVDGTSFTASGPAYSYTSNFTEVLGYGFSCALDSYNTELPFVDCQFILSVYNVVESDMTIFLTDQA